MSDNCWMSGRQADPDEIPSSAVSHLGLHCLLRPVCPNTYGKYDTLYLNMSVYCLFNLSVPEHSLIVEILVLVVLIVTDIKTP